MSKSKVHTLSHLDVAQGGGEKRSKPYSKYGDTSIAASQRSDTPKTTSVRLPLAVGRES